MRIIAITGPSGSGKSTLAENLAKELACTHVNIDKVGHDVLSISEVSKRLQMCFGAQIADSGVINRKALGEIVFGNPNSMSLLVDITWGEMEKLIDQAITKETEKGSKFIILDYALLPLTKYWNKENLKICLSLPKELRYERIMKRDNVSMPYIQKRDSSAVDFKEISYDLSFEGVVSKEEFIKKVKSLLK